MNRILMRKVWGQKKMKNSKLWSLKIKKLSGECQEEELNLRHKSPFNMEGRKLPK